MLNFRDFFKHKHITVMGLGLLGRGLGDVLFLARCGARLTVTDLKTKTELAPSLQKLKRVKNISYVLGRHRLEDFRDCDMVLKGAGVPLNSPYIREAKKHGIPVEMDESLFAKLASGVRIVGVTGTRGKSTTTMLLFAILSAYGKTAAGRKRLGRIFLGGNLRDTASLPLLTKVRPGDTVVMELSSWQLQGWGDAGLSPAVAVFTNFLPDHMNYYAKNMRRYFQDKSYIYQFQKKGDILVVGPSLAGKIRNAKAKLVVADEKHAPKSWRVKIPGTHNLENIACAAAVARGLRVPEPVIRRAVEHFSGMPGRLEKVRTVRGVDIYNDTNSTTPVSTIAALASFPRRVILIMGGADKGLDTRELAAFLPKKTKHVFLLPGSGSDAIRLPSVRVQKVADLGDALREAMRRARRGDVILLSPAFASFGMFQNEYDRGEQFIKLVQKLI